MASPRLTDEQIAELQRLMQAELDTKEAFDVLKTQHDWVRWSDAIYRAQQGARNALPSLLAEVAESREIIAKMPKCGDGSPAIVGMDCVVLREDTNRTIEEDIVILSIEADGEDFCVTLLDKYGEEFHDDLANIFPTREAAEAARKTT